MLLVWYLFEDCVWKVRKLQLKTLRQIWINCECYVFLFHLILIQFLNLNRRRIDKSGAKTVPCQTPQSWEIQDENIMVFEERNYFSIFNIIYDVQYNSEVSVQFCSTAFWTGSNWFKIYVWFCSYYVNYNNSMVKFTIIQHECTPIFLEIRLFRDCVLWLCLVIFLCYFLQCLYFLLHNI